MLNFPATSVNAVREVPFTCTVTLPIGFLSTSVTVPEMVCENEAAEKSKKENSKNNLFMEAEVCLCLFLIIASLVVNNPD